MRILTVNAGSSSLKLSLLGPGDAVLARPETLDDLAELPAPDAVGHRVVHGGREFTGPVRIDDEVERRLRALTGLAPLHQPVSIDGIDAVRRVLPAVPEVACFDTAFHARMPEAAATYALPAAWRERYGVRRYGFHGLSHAYATRRAGEMLGGVPRRLVVCHLGAGASLCAVADGRSVDTTMGFTPLEGLVMATRSGSVDPGLILWLQRHEGLSAGEVERALEHESGLLGLAGTADMREIAAPSLALDVYAHRLRAGIAAMAAALGGLDALVFTGGVGEHSPDVRLRAAEGLAFLGVALDPARNETAGTASTPDAALKPEAPSKSGASEAPAKSGEALRSGAASKAGTASESRTDSEIGAPGARVRTLVVTAREDLEIAAGVREVLAP